MFLSVVVCTAWLMQALYQGGAPCTAHVCTHPACTAHSPPQETRPTSRVFIDLEIEPEPSLQEDAQFNIVQSH